MLMKDMFKKPTYFTISSSDNRNTAKGKKQPVKVRQTQGMQTILESKIQNGKQETEDQPHVPTGIWNKCTGCGATLYMDDVARNRYVCYKCGKYLRLHADKRIALVTDQYTFREWDKGIRTSNPLDYECYEEKIEKLKKDTKLDEAVVTGWGMIHGEKAVLAVCDARFMMGSMGYVVGEKITRAIEKATEMRLPIIIFCCSGGARMQEGMVSLMQMAKTSQALKKHSDAGLLYISVLTDPTTGGVTASFAMLGDIILGEPGALVGFAGPRVIEQTIRQKLPKGFQTTEFLVEHGIIDGIIERTTMKETLFQLIRFHKAERRKKAWTDEIFPLEEKTVPVSEMDAWSRVLIARSLERPTALDYIQLLFKDFMELHGDRRYSDDGAIVGGLATFHGVPVTVIGQQKGKNTKENIHRNFGMPKPEGYGKALRFMNQAEKFDRPIICLVDTPGAFCGMEAEERGQGAAIARNLMEMSGIKVPILSIVIGEGGSGGALAMAVADEVWMLENAMYSILSPEGFASILWKDSGKAPKAARVMKITAQELQKLGIVEKIIPEREPVSLKNIKTIGKNLDWEISRFLRKYNELDKTELIDRRYERFRRM